MAKSYHKNCWVTMYVIVCLILDCSLHQNVIVSWVLLLISKEVSNIMTFISLYTYSSIHLDSFFPLAIIPIELWANISHIVFQFPIKTNRLDCIICIASNACTHYKTKYPYTLNLLCNYKVYLWETLQKRSAPNTSVLYIILTNSEYI